MADGRSPREGANFFRGQPLESVVHTNNRLRSAQHAANLRSCRTSVRSKASYRKANQDALKTITTTKGQ